MNRRQFLRSVALTGAGSLMLPRTSLFGANAPNNKLNIALIGTWGRGEAHFGALASENVVALCDINEEHLAFGAKKFPEAKPYVDWRQCLDQKGLDAVVCCTADHTHAFVANWALNRGYHVYCEKPLANSVEEARVVRANYLKNKSKLATQCGTQRHEYENFNRVRELIQDGVIGQLEAVSTWGNRKIPRPGYLPAEGEPPKHLHYDLWIGPSPFHPYNPGYFSGGPGANCLQWNMYWDFGSGQIGDMGSHTMDIAWNAIDTTLPTSVEAKGDPFNPEVTPVKLEFHCKMPANPWRPGIRVSWYQGGAMPESPSRMLNLNRIDHGALFEGTKGCLVSDFNNRAIFPSDDKADLTYYKPRAKEALIPKMGNFQKQWIHACKGDLKTSCDFEYSGNMIETMLLGLVAYRAGKTIEYDSATGRITNIPEANELLRRKYRPGWPLDG
ncbi:MAG TPA: Gfo/Idh/MocA family oxidoreductase [Candidatus Paceibacterota bacterium]|nr:Gfo/Idh/MocA family oxidoreductase [Verrucomicrobiota bacterium]HRY51215.1 Gfo/Idh/MocA family oxidoreductase [Candidatus Paceibacterota bacterium]HSA00166.1 Gfo/Idh/MocA family oxidoreductase [Candidatus Paceibacterota bacterium]